MVGLQKITAIAVTTRCIKYKVFAYIFSIKVSFWNWVLFYFAVLSLVLDKRIPKMGLKTIPSSKTRHFHFTVPSVSLRQNLLMNWIRNNWC